MRSEAAKRAPREHYPAPYALIDLWEKHGGDADAMQKAEDSSFAKLMVTRTAQNLVRVFFLREKMKKLAGTATWDGSHVHVIGAGAMGGDIAAWCAWHGFARHARRHQAGADRRRDQARRASCSARSAATTAARSATRSTG